MDWLEVQSAARNVRLGATHPRWWASFLKGGREALLREIMRDSIKEVRSAEYPADLDRKLSMSTVSSIGRMGAIQEFLYRVVLHFRPSTVVETGVYRGLSSAFILAAMEDVGGGSLLSIDLPPSQVHSQGAIAGRLGYVSEGTSPGFAVPGELRRNWTLVIGDTRECLPTVLKRLGTIDMFFHDSDHSAQVMNFEFGQALEHLSPSGVIVSDDVGWNSAFQDMCRDEKVRYVRIVNDRLGIARGFAQSGARQLSSQEG